MAPNFHHSNPIQVDTKIVIQTDQYGQEVSNEPYPPNVPQHEMPPLVLRHFLIGVGKHDNDPGEVINHYQPKDNDYNTDEDEDRQEEDSKEEEGPLNYHDWLMDQQLVIVDEDPHGYHDGETDDNIVPEEEQDFDEEDED